MQEEGKIGFSELHWQDDQGLPHDVGPALIIFTEHIKEKEVHIIVQRLVVQEQLCEVAQILAVQLLLLAIHLHAHGLSTAEQACKHGNMQHANSGLHMNQPRPQVPEEVARAAQLQGLSDSSVQRSFPGAQAG